MQFKKLSTPLTAMALALATAFSLLPRPSLAEGQKGFFCGTHLGKPATLFWTETGNHELIGWERQIGGVLPLERCKQVSNRLQRLYSNGHRHMKTGKVNNQPVICLARNDEESCDHSNLLVTLLPTDNANIVLNDLINPHQRGSRRVILNGNQEINRNPKIKLIIQQDGFASIDIQNLMDIRANQENYPQFTQD